MSTAFSTEPTKRKRRRLIIACLECHRRRVKCDRGEPCNACVRHGVGDSCAYEPMTTTKEAVAGHSKSKEAERPTESVVHDFFNFATESRQPYNDPQQTTNWFTQPWQNVSTSDTTTSSIRAPSPQRISALRSSHDGSSKSPPNPEDPSPASSSSSYQQMETAPMARFLRRSQVEQTQSSNAGSSSKTSPSQKDGSTYAYTREEAIRIRKACAHWPPMSRIPNLVRFYFAELNCFYNIMDEDYVNTFIARRVLPLLDCKSDDEFYYRVRPGDATKLALTATMIINSALRCSAGLLALWFTSREPKGRIRDDAYTAEARDVISAQIRASVKTLLTECMQLDEPSYDKVRATICWMETLKSEGSLAGPEAVVWFPRLTKVAEEIDLFNEPPKEVGETQREMHRWTFVDFVACNWFGATIYGEHLRVPSETLKTDFPSKFKEREQEVKMLRFKMGKVFGDLSQVTKNGTTDWRKVDDIDEEVQEYLRSIPNEFKPETVSGNLNAFKPSLLQNHASESKALRLQKHLLNIFYNFLRGLTHRTRFFPHPDIPEERVQHSRSICVESAKNILWLQQENRAESFSDAWVRGFHYVYITLEHAVVLILAALTTLGDAETEYQANMHDSRISTEWEGGPLQEAVRKARSLLEWSQRAADISSGLPMDVSTNIQASQFLNRLQTKANNLIDWYESYAKSSTGPRLAIFSAATATKHLLSDSDGKTLPIPMLHGNIVMKDSQDFLNGKKAEATQKISNQSTQDPMLFLGSHAVLGTPSQNNHQGQSPSNQLTPSQALHFDNNSMSDLIYMGGLDNTIFSLPRTDAEDPLSMFDSAPPLEEQIDVWLALLQQ